MNDYRFSKSSRLLKSAEFDRVFSRRCSQADRVVAIYVARSQQKQSRLGIVATRKLGGAVVRNRWKRLIREAFRLVQAELPEGLDIVVLPRRGVEPELAALQASLKGLVPRAAERLPKIAGEQVPP